MARCWAGFASFGTGLVHIAVIREHLAESWAQGTFFIVVGLAQIAWALWALSRETVPAPRLTAAATLALIALWGISRTVGLSLDPLTSVPEPAGTPDLFAVLLEIALILCVLAAIPRAVTTAAPSEPPSLGKAALSGRFVALLAVGALAVSAIATPAMAASGAGQHGSTHGH